MKYKNLFKRGIVTILAASMLLTGCGTNATSEETAVVEEADEIETEETVENETSEAEENKETE